MQPNFTPSMSLQRVQEEFQAGREAYVSLQKRFQEAVQETQRLEQAAEALKAEAEEANGYWKEMAKQRVSDQRKINAEIDRSVSLTQQAEGLLRTAAVRQELHRELLVQLADARFELATLRSAVNDLYRSERLKALLALPGLREALEEIYAIERFNLRSGIEGVDRVAYSSEQDVQRACDAAFFRAVGLTREVAAPEVAVLPNPVKGEVVASTPLALRRFKKACGEVPLEALAAGAHPARPIPGIRQF